jgi:hypothetical protein
MTIAEAQRDMRIAYRSGALGMFASATAWLVAGAVSMRWSPERGVWALFVGGMLIHPVAQLLLRASGSSAQHSRGNPMGRLALESTIWMIFSLPLAYAVSRFQMSWFFPAMMLVIGGRYLTFATMFGLRTYWICGGGLALAAYAMVRFNSAPHTSAFVGASIEIAVASYLLLTAKGEQVVDAPHQPHSEQHE